MVDFVERNCNLNRQSRRAACVVLSKMCSINLKVIHGASRMLHSTFFHGVRGISSVEWPLLCS